MRKFLFSCTVLAAFGANAAADPFVSGSEPGWGNHMTSKQHRQTGFDDVETALRTNHQPEVPTTGVKGYTFNVITIRHGLHGHGGSGSGGGGGASGNSGGININFGGGGGNSGQRSIPPPAPQFSTSQIIFEPFGVFTTRQECDAARAEKIAQLDKAYLRFPHLPANAHEKVTHLPGGGVIVEKEGSQERMDVTFCEPGIYAPGSSNGIASNIQTTGAAPRSEEPIELTVAPGSVKQWVSPRPFARVFPGTSEVVEVLSASGQELVFMVKPDVDLPPTTNILLINDDGEVVANLRIVIPGRLNYDLRQGPNGSQIYRKDNPNYVPPKEKK